MSKAHKHAAATANAAGAELMVDLSQVTEATDLQAAPHAEQHITPMVSSPYDHLHTKSAKIRAMHADGFSRADIARALGILYQHVRNVLTQELKRGPHEALAASEVQTADASAATSTDASEEPEEVIEHAA